MPHPSNAPATWRLRTSCIGAILISISLLFTSTMIIAGVGPLLPQPQRDANIRLGAILALACSATFCSAVLVMTEIINFRKHTRNFLCVPLDESYRIRSESESDSSTDESSSSSRAAAGSNSSQEQRQQQRGSATTSSDANQPTPSNTGSEPPDVKSEGASTEKGRNVEKSSDVATQTERRGTVRFELP